MMNSQQRIYTRIGPSQCVKQIHTLQDIPSSTLQAIGTIESMVHKCNWIRSWSIIQSHIIEIHKSSTSSPQTVTPCLNGLLTLPRAAPFCTVTAEDWLLAHVPSKSYGPGNGHIWSGSKYIRPRRHTVSSYARVQQQILVRLTSITPVSFTFGHSVPRLRTVARSKANSCRACSVFPYWAICCVSNGQSALILLIHLHKVHFLTRWRILCVKAYNRIVSVV